MKRRKTKGLKRNFGSERGDMAYVETFVSAFALMIFIAFAINIFSFFKLSRDLEYFSERVVESAAAAGGTEGIGERIDNLCLELGLSREGLNCSFEGSSFIPGSVDRVQYGDVIRFNVSYETELRATGILSVPVTVTSGASGLSEKYWKR